MCSLFLVSWLLHLTPTPNTVIKKTAKIQLLLDNGVSPCKPHEAKYGTGFGREITGVSQILNTRSQLPDRSLQVDFQAAAHAALPRSAAQSPFYSVTN
jgi:hypothetical protein